MVPPKSPSLCDYRIRNTQGIFLIAISYFVLQEFISDVFFPSFPSLASTFQISSFDFSKNFYVYFIYAFYLFSFIVSLISDSINRNVIFISFYLVCALGFVIGGLATDYNWFLFGRVLQGVGFATIGAIHPAIQQSLPENQAMKVRVQAMAYAGLLSLGTPFIGSFLLDFMGQKSTFFMSALLMLAMSIITPLYYKDMSVKVPFHISSTLKTFKSLLLSPAFLLISICNGLAFGATISFTIKGPPLLSDELGLSPLFYRAALVVMALELFFSGYVGKLLSSWGWGVQKQTVVGFGCLGLAGALFFLLPLVFGPHAACYLIPFAFANVGYNLGQAGAISLCLGLGNGLKSGAISALSSLLRITVAMTAAEVLTMWSTTTQYLVGIHLVAASVGLPIALMWKSIEGWSLSKGAPHRRDNQGTPDSLAPQSVKK